ncbi:MAG: hypothetical protein WC763_01400 [Candidatus Paceibacterota bacterium]|jgi:hypothetical protein
MKHHIIAFALLVSVAVPVLALAADTQTTGTPVQTTSAPLQTTGTPLQTSGTPVTPAKVPLKDTSASVKLENPLGDKVKTIPDFFYLVINFVYSLSYAVIALFLIISGFKFVIAQGKPDALEDAKKTFKYTIVGAILLIGANVITEVVRTVINKFVTTSI